ncbi:MAG: AAA family ATPase, partial [Minisyncoccales bacterium]
MKLKRIILENIRSYEYEEIEFPEGSILMSGDIGSGKTSILLAVEFALFGLQPGKRGTSLLKNGAEEGRVKLWFEVDKQEVEIERTLKRNSKTVSQDKCFISLDGQQEETSVTELKDKVLELLNYPKEFAKKQNLLYKFTVYTPQEEMKQIILQDPETRVNTIRHVFGIDKYKKILENSSVLVSRIREERRKKEGATQNLEEDKKNLKEKQEQLEKEEKQEKEAEKEVEEKKKIREKEENELEVLNKKIEERKKYNQEIEKTKIMISNKKETLSENQKNI